jgi:trk system potassium uptake protein TrkH
LTHIPGTDSLRDVNILAVVRIIGVLLLWTAVAMLPPLFLSIRENDWPGWLAAVAVTTTMGLVMWLRTPSQVTIDRRGGLVVVGLGWLALVFVGSLPFLFTGIFTGIAPGVVGAVFESVSGFTTTGATVFSAIEELPPSILLWRSISHWLGGMGIIVLGVAILPFVGVGGAQLFHAEAPGISGDRLTPRIASTARLLWAVYAALTGVLFLIYLLLGMSAFDAVNHAMSTLATGGFSTRTDSLGAFSPAIQWVTIVFMLIAGTNFALHYRMVARGGTAWFKDLEWQVYVGMAIAASAICFVALLTQAEREVGQSVSEVLRHAMFNVTAVISTTGFATADFAQWPSVCLVVLIGLMFMGAMGGSTGGGFKVVRVVVLAKQTLGEFQRVLHPQAVIVTRLGRQPVRPDVLLKVVGLFALYVATHGMGTVFLAALGYDFVTSASAALAAMSSIGPGLGLVGPSSHYGDLHPAALAVLSALMLLGRLEFYTLLVLFIPDTWRGSRRRSESGKQSSPEKNPQ